MQLLFGPVPEPGVLEWLLFALFLALGPVLIASLLGWVVYDRFRGRTAANRGPAANAEGSDKWWWLVAVQPVGFLFLFPLSLLLQFLPTPSAIIIGFVGVMWVLKIFSPLAVYFDRKYLAAVSDWSPSVAYYLVFLPVAGLLLAAMYVYERHEHVGVP